MDENSQITPELVGNIHDQASDISSKSGRLKWVLLIIIGLIFLLITVGTSAYYLGLQKSKSESVSLIQPSIITPTPSSQSDTNVIDSKTTYTNTTYGYSIQYPSHWLTDVWSDESAGEKSMTFGKYKMKVGGENEFKKLGYLVEVWIEPNSKMEEILEIHDVFKDRSDYSRDKILFNGFPAYKIIHTGYDWPRDAVIFEKNGIIYTIYLTYLDLEMSVAEKIQAQSDYNEMLSTFQFTD
jgi:hypothetical protein